MFPPAAVAVVLVPVMTSVPQVGVMPDVPCTVAAVAMGRPVEVEVRVDDRARSREVIRRDLTTKQTISRFMK